MTDLYEWQERGLGIKSIEKKDTTAWRSLTAMTRALYRDMEERARNVSDMIERNEQLIYSGGRLCDTAREANFILRDEYRTLQDVLPTVPVTNDLGVCEWFASVDWE